MMGVSVNVGFNSPAIRARAPAWNKGGIVGQKRSLTPKYIRAIKGRA